MSPQVRIPNQLLSSKPPSYSLSHDPTINSPWHYLVCFFSTAHQQQTNQCEPKPTIQTSQLGSPSTTSADRTLSCAEPFDSSTMYHAPPRQQTKHNHKHHLHPYYYDLSSCFFNAPGAGTPTHPPTTTTPKMAPGRTVTHFLGHRTYLPHPRLIG